MIKLHVRSKSKIRDSIYILPDESAMEIPYTADRLELIDKKHDMTPMDYSVDLKDKTLTVRDRHSRIIFNYYNDNLPNKKGLDLNPENAPDFLEELSTDPNQLISFLTERIQYLSLEIHKTCDNLYNLHEQAVRGIEKVLSEEEGATLDSVLKNEDLINKIPGLKEEVSQIVNYARLKDTESIQKLLDLIKEKEDHYKQNHKYLVDSKNLLDNARTSILEAFLVETPETEEIERIEKLISIIDELEKKKSTKKIDIESK